MCSFKCYAHNFRARRTHANSAAQLNWAEFTCARTRILVLVRSTNVRTTETAHDMTANRDSRFAIRERTRLRTEKLVILTVRNFHSDNEHNDHGRRRVVLLCCALARYLFNICLIPRRARAFTCARARALTCPILGAEPPATQNEPRVSPNGRAPLVHARGVPCSDCAHARAFINKAFTQLHNGTPHTRTQRNAQQL